MSVYKNIEDDEIDISFMDKEVSVYTGYDYAGSIYGILTFEQIKAIYDKIEACNESDTS